MVTCNNKSHFLNLNTKVWLILGDLVLLLETLYCFLEALILAFAYSFAFGAWLFLVQAFCMEHGSTGQAPEGGAYVKGI